MRLKITISMQEVELKMLDELAQGLGMLSRSATIKFLVSSYYQNKANQKLINEKVATIGRKVE
jgi:metal-responsive CopG/Arc/MetJ family transcriptional regulator